MARFRSRRGALILLGGAVVVLVGGFALVYFVLFPTSSPKRFTLTSPTTGTSAEAPAAASGGSGFAGTWTIAQGSQAGYRVREKLAFLPAQSDAVGRTSAITGAATLSEAGKTVKVTAASFKVDVSQLTSDKSMRDQRIRSIGLQSDQFPTATFKLSKPVTLPASAASGTVAKVSATGVFNIHGTSKQETVPLAMRLSSSGIEAVGAITFPWSEFNMTAPSVAGFVNVTDKATMEFDLHLRRGS